MKINFLGPHIKIAGGVKALLYYANLLAQKGHRVNFLVLSKSPWKNFIFNLIFKKPLWFGSFNAKVIKVPEFSDKCIPNGDIVVATAWRTAESADSLNYKKGRKFYFIQHYESLYHGDPSLVDRTYQLNLEKIVISSWLKEIIKKKFRSDSHLLITPVDRRLFYFHEKFRKEKPLRILLLDHIYKWKGTEEGYRVLQNIKKIYPDIKIVGFGVRRKKPRLKYDDYFYNPPQKKLAEIYSSCHIYLCPSEFEGLGMPSMEAMACKCVLVTFDNGGSRDYAIDGKTAFVAAHADFNDLYLKLKTAVENKELRDNIAKNGFDFINQMPSWEEQTNRLENIFKEALSKNA